MRLMAKWQDSWDLIAPSNASRGRLNQLRLGGELVDVVRMGRGEPIILVPGLAGSWKLVLPLAKRLAKHFEVITYGLPGDRFPKVRPDRPYAPIANLGGHAEDLANLIAQLGLEAPTVFGVSFGGAIALETAVDYPSRIGGLIVYGAESKFRSRLGGSIARRVLDRYPLPTDSRFINQFFNLLHGRKPEPGSMVDFVTDRIWETDQKVMARRLAQLETFDVSDRLWRINVPSLVVAGSKDVIVPANRQRDLARNIAGANFESIEGAGHIGFLTHAAEVVRSIRRHHSRVKVAI
jgi:pimeloyl-ACP methyl ester carboxylesterase